MNTIGKKEDRSKTEQIENEKEWHKHDTHVGVDRCHDLFYRWGGDGNTANPSVEFFKGDNMKISIWEKAMIKRYNLTLPKELYKEIETIAIDSSTTVLNVIKKFMKIGLIMVNCKKAGDKIIIEKDGEQREIVIDFD